MATLDSILQAAHVGETSDWEFKSAAGGLPGSMWETYSAMANTEGGTIVLGVAEQDGRARLDGLTPDRAERYRRELWSTVRNRGKVSVDLLREDSIETVPFGGACLVAIHVPRASRSQRPVYLNAQPLGNTFRRRHEGDFRCTEEEVRRMFADAEATPADFRVLPGFGPTDLDAASLTQYRQRMRAAKGEHPWLALEDRDLLEKLGGWRHDRETGVSGLTLAGVLMFGKTEAIRDPAAAPRFQVDYREILDPDLRWSDREHPDGTWEGNLFQFYQRVWPKLGRGLPVPFQLEEGRRRDETPVHEALREAFVNALIHADHSALGGVVVERHTDRFVLENPGTLLVSREQFWRGGVSECRNKALQQMFLLMGGGERAGSGVDKIKSGWRSQHWRTPILEERQDPDRVSLRLPMLSLIPETTLADLRERFGDSVVKSLGEPEIQALATAQLEGDVSNARLQELVEMHPADISRMLSGLCNRFMLVSDARRRWTRYRIPEGPPAPVPVTGASSSLNEGNSSPKAANSSLKTASSSLKERDPQTWACLFETAQSVSTTRRTDPEDVRNAIMKLCSGRFLTLAEMAELLSRRPDSLRNSYLTPMLKEGLLERRFPNDPNHPQQAYRASAASVPPPVNTGS